MYKSKLEKEKLSPTSPPTDKSLIGDFTKWLMMENDDGKEPSAKSKPETDKVKDGEVDPVNIGEESPPWSKPPQVTIPSSLLISCDSCGHNFSKRASTCPKCGTDRLAECQVCQKQIFVHSANCPECGDPDPFMADTGTRQHESRAVGSDRYGCISPNGATTIPDGVRKIKLKKLFRWSIFSVGCILALGIYAVWKDYERHHGGSFISGFLRGGIIFGGLATLWAWAKNSDEQPKDENTKLVNEKQPPSI